MRALLLLLIPSLAHADPCFPADGNLDARLTKDAVEVCLDKTCLRMPLATRAWEPLAVKWPDPPEVKTVATMKTTFTTIVNLCNGADCHDVEVPGMSSIKEEDVVANASRNLVAVIGAAQPTKHEPGRPIYVFDGTKQVATIPGWKTGMGDPGFFRGIRFLGDTLWVLIADTPVSAGGRLYTARGKLLADLGSMDEQALVDLGGGTWAFGTFGGDRIDIRDVATGKSRARIKTTPSAETPGAMFALFARTGDGKSLVAMPGEARRGLTVVNLETYAAKRVAVPVCK